jgi:hypothetical protein
MRLLYLVVLLGTTACGPAVDLEGDRAELLRLHDQARTAHLEERVDLMQFPESLMQVSRGAVRVESRAQNEERFRAYFDRSTFQEWDDIAPPLIRISPDGRMAYVVVQKRVRLTAPDSVGVPQPEHVVFAWVEIYEKRDSKWTLTLVASTDRPGDA